MPECYDKPIWTLRALAAAAPRLPGHAWRVLPTFAGWPISQVLRERIMLAVAAENRCWYCQTAHRVFGEAAGVAPAEVDRLLAGDDTGRPERERVALAFARDLARRGFHSRDEALWERLGELWAPAERAAIESTAHVMNLANRFGNTFDAARERLAGRCERTGASALDLAVVSAVFAPAALAVLPTFGATALWNALRRRRRNGGDRPRDAELAPPTANM